MFSISIAAALVSSGALAQTREQCQARCAGSQNSSQCFEDCVLSSKKPNVQQMAPSHGKAQMRPLTKACPAGWVWSEMKSRCINIGHGGTIR